MFRYLFAGSKLLLLSGLIARDGLDYFDATATLRLTVAPVPEPSNWGLLITISVLWLRPMKHS